MEKTVNNSDIIQTTLPGLSLLRAGELRDKLLNGQDLTDADKAMLASVMICISEGEPINPIVEGNFDIYKSVRSTIKVADMTGIQYFKAACETTSNKEIKSVDRLVNLKQRMYMAEHSPIRMREFWINLTNIPSFVATHLVRHHVGIDHYQLSHRFDRTNVPDERTNRMTPTNISMHVNAQALINMARKRQCTKASPETRLVMGVIKEAIGVLDPDLSSAMVPECIYRGFCPEEKSCGYLEMMRKAFTEEGESKNEGNKESDSSGKDNIQGNN